MNNSTNGVALVGDIVRHHTLPSGGEVVLRDPRQLRAKDKKYVVDHMRDDTSTRGRVLDVLDGAAALLVEKWHIPYLPDAPLPRDMPDILGELTIPDLDYLHEAVGPAVALLFPSVTPDDAQRPGSPTVPASD